MGTIFDSIILRQILVETTSIRTPITPTQKQRNNNFEAQVNFQCNVIVWHIAASQTITPTPRAASLIVTFCPFKCGHWFFYLLNLHFCFTFLTVCILLTKKTSSKQRKEVKRKKLKIPNNVIQKGKHINLILNENRAHAQCGVLHDCTLIDIANNTNIDIISIDSINYKLYQQTNQLNDINYYNSN